MWSDAEWEMMRYLPGAILAACGVAVYAIGCVLFIAQRRQRQGANKSLFVYAIILMVLGFAALGAGLFALELAQYRAVHG
jgi:cytochrome bd-type quinol oxidase subunit 1